MPARFTPSRILLLKPCCIGDVVLTTPLLSALRRAYPDAHITWGVGTHSAAAVAHHTALDAVLSTGSAANPAKSPAGLLRLVRQIRGGRFDMAVVPVRSPLITLAVWLAGVPVRVGLNSARRGRLYNIRANINPADPRHEADITLDLARLLDIDTTGCWANVPAPPDADLDVLLPPDNTPLIVVHVGGGKNPGMTMAEKRPPIPLLADVARRAAAHTGGRIVLLGGPDDHTRADALREALADVEALSLVGRLDFPQIAALGQKAALVIGPDTGVLHLLAAAGAKTVMIFGPSDPRRYAPFVPPGQAAAPWRPYPLPEGGVASGPPPGWTWAKDGVSADEVWAAAKRLLE